MRARFRFSDWLSLEAEFQDSRAYLEDDNTPVGTGLVNTAELLRAYLDLSFDGPFGGAHELQLGRLTMDIGSRRLVARNRFRNTSNAFTGVDWRWRNHMLDFTPEHAVVDMAQKVRRKLRRNQPRRQRHADLPDLQCRVEYPREGGGDPAGWARIC